METQPNVKTVKIKIIYSQYGLEIAILFRSSDKLRNKSILCFPILSCNGLKALYNCKLSSVIDDGEVSYHLGDGETKMWRGENNVTHS